jgi:mono/diheme cytochrome c family protein
VAFTGMTDSDIADLYAFLRTQPASAQPSRKDDIRFPFNIRPLLVFWRVLHFRHGPLDPVAGQTAEWNRGRYLAEAVAHCGECHTPRNALGGLENDKAYAGDPDLEAPNITPGSKSSGKWTVAELTEVLNSGMTPDGDYVAGEMATVVDGTAKLTDADRKAIAAYIKSMPARASTPGKPKAKKPS